MIHPDIQSTFDYLFALAHEALSQGRSFAPFATAVQFDDARTHSSADLPTAISEPAQHISALLDALQQDAARGGLRVAGLAFDSVVPLDNGVRSDAVVIHVETVTGEAMQIFVPYTRTGSPVPKFEEPLLQNVAPRIFKS